MPAGDGVWRVAGLGGFGAFGGFGEFWRFWRVCGLANGSFESLRKPLLWPGLEVFGSFGSVVCGLANGSFESPRKSLLWI